MLSTEALTYGTIRRDYQHREFPEEVLLDHYAKAVSPLLTPLFVRWKVTPNGVTVAMIVCGVLGALLFAIPWVPSRICGAIFIQLWMILDCCDGEVARISHIFSAFGQEMDNTAHVVCHPLFNLSFAWVLISSHRYGENIILWTSIVSISSELVLRHCLQMSHIISARCTKSRTDVQVSSTYKKTAISLVGLFSLYPNFALLFPIAYFIDRYLGTSVSFYYLLCQAAVSTLVAIRMTPRWIKTMARA